jgi:hypothetical protein
VLSQALLAHQFVSKLKPSFDRWRLDMHNNALMGVAGAFPPNVAEAARIATNYQMSNDDRGVSNHQSYLTRKNDNNPKTNFERKFKELEKKHKALLEKNAQKEL